jgi:acetolactate synthase-1/2/3 large subunit
MQGAEALVRTLVGCGVDVCFTNPGTSEMHFVAALDRVPGLRPILGLFEGVVAGAADGYGRMAGRPAATLLHLGPGLANGLANFHNARKAHTPVVSLVGDHAVRHRAHDAPLSADVEGFARPVSCWLHTADDVRRLPRAGAEAVAAACAPPGGVATLVVPADAASGECAGPAAPVAAEKPAAPDAAAVAGAARALASGEPAALLAGGSALRGVALETLGRIAAASGSLLLCDTFNARVERGAGRSAPAPLPYFPEATLELLRGVRHLVVAGTQAPVAFFAYPDLPSSLVPPGCAVHVLCDPGGDVAAALDALAGELGARHAPAPRAPRERPAPPGGALHPEAIGASLAALLPEGAIVAEEAITGAAALWLATRAAAPHDWLGLTGGAIGQGLPLATGAAVACPGRKVVCLEADGSAMYTLQALWTQAREGLDVTTVVLANRSYAVLGIELARLGAAPGPRSRELIELTRPALDFVALARGLGVPAARATSAEDFHSALAAALAEPGPRLVEAVY